MFVDFGEIKREREGEEWERERERERETLSGCLPYVSPIRESNPQPRYVPLPRTEPAAFWCTGTMLQPTEPWPGLLLAFLLFSALA